MGWINEIVGICMAAHFDWAWDEDRERGGSGEVGRAKRLTTHTHTHARQLRASRLRLPSPNLQLTFFVNRGAVCEQSVSSVCDCAYVPAYSPWWPCVHVCSLASAFIQPKINFYLNPSPHLSLFSQHLSFIEIQNTENTHFFISLVLLTLHIQINNTRLYYGSWRFGYFTLTCFQAK